MKESLKQEYEKIEKKYSLPSFSSLDKEFEIRSLEVNKSGILIKAILRIVTNKLHVFMSYLEAIVSGVPQNFHAMMEVRNVPEKEREKIVSFYKELSILLHENLAVELKSEKEIAFQINKIWKSWNQIKEQELKFLDLIVEAWKLKEPDQKSKNESAG